MVSCSDCLAVLSDVQFCIACSMRYNKPVDKPKRKPGPKIKPRSIGKLEDQERVRAERLKIRTERLKKNQEDKRIRSAQYYAANPSYWTQWKRRNRDKVRASTQRRRVHKQSASDTLTPEQIQYELNIGQSMYPNEELALHHVVPISRGGGHTWGNIIFIPSALNSSIGSKLPQEVYKQLAFDWG